ncbi:MAG: tRNA pseudouridine(13) synthase TruD [Candidatus Brocadiae bacterium]|nr:tRNA pseudouridine(13) synthase TruD [Candidatus Brocadiia bacterium]
MKLKSRPEDFIVVEDNQVAWDPQGSFAVYRVTKTSLNTFDVVNQLVARLGTTRARVNYSGLKDRHAVTEQVFTVLQGPARSLEGAGWTAEYAGRSSAPVKPSTLTGNRFTITLRAVHPGEVAEIRATIDRVRRTGLPNYFDDQRFGSARHGQGFFGKAAIRGDWEEALRLVIACPSAKDSARDKRTRGLTQKLWGRWDELTGRLERGQERTIAQYLAEHPGDFRGACNRIDRNLLGLLLVAWQSWLWNEVAAGVIRDSVARVEELAYSRGIFVYPLEMTAAEAGSLEGRDLPVACHRTEWASDDERKRYETVLAREGIRIEDFHVDLEKHTFRAFRRPLLLRPGGLSLGAFEPDPMNPGLLFFRLNFSLPRGSFATILIKALQRRNLVEAEDDDDDGGA